MAQDLQWFQSTNNEYYMLLVSINLTGQFIYICNYALWIKHVGPSQPVDS